MHAQYYPMFVSLKNRVCLVVGGGAVGERKVRGLLPYGATLRLVAEELTPWLQAQCDQGTVLLVGKRYGRVIWRTLIWFLRSPMISP